jgi:hypothetical protein
MRKRLARTRHLEKRISFRLRWKGRGSIQAYCVLSVLKTFYPLTENSVCFGPNLKRRLAILCIRGREIILFMKHRFHFALRYSTAHSVQQPVHKHKLCSFYWVFKLEFQQPNFETKYRAVEIHNWPSLDF